MKNSKKGTRAAKAHKGSGTPVNDEKMSCYEGFAEMYDALMADTPYENWAAYIDGAICDRFKGISRKKITVLDIACGTAGITLRLAEKGYDLTGADISEDMLAEASRKAREAGYTDILFLRQDMRDLNLYGTVDAVVCVCDGMNYILSDDDLSAVFKRVRLFLNPGGIFIFDMNTEYKFKEMFGVQIFEGRGANGEAYEWENFYDPVTRINEYRLTLFSLENRVHPFEELHRQRAYPSADVCNMLLAAGFSSVVMRDGYTANTPHAESERVVYIVEG